MFKKMRERLYKIELVRDLSENIKSLASVTKESVEDYPIGWYFLGFSVGETLFSYFVAPHLLDMNLISQNISDFISKAGYVACVSGLTYFLFSGPREAHNC